MSNLEARVASLLEVFKEMDVNYNQIQENLFSLGMSGDNVKGVRYFVNYDEQIGLKEIMKFQEHLVHI